MATPIRDERSGDGRDREYAEILAQLRSIRENGGARPAPITDPSVNVKEIVDIERRHQNELRVAEAKRQDDLAEMRERHSRELDAQREKAATAAKLQEASRIDALLQANTGNVALALGKTETQALAQDRRIAILEQNQYSGAGREIQRTEGRQVNQWAVGLFVGVVVVAAEVALRLSGH